MANSGFSFAGVAEKVAAGVFTAAILSISSFAGAIGMGWLRVEEWWWAAPVMYALVAGGLIFGISYGLLFQIRARLYWGVFTVLLACMFGVLLYVDKRSQKQAVVSLPTSSSPWGLTNEQIQQLKYAFLSIPRPCFVKITAAADNMNFRQGFLRVFEESFFYVYRGAAEIGVAKCNLIEGKEDRHPNLYPKELSQILPGMVVVNALPGDLAADFLVEILRSEQIGLKARTGTILPPGAEKSFYHIQIGAGALREEKDKRG